MANLDLRSKVVEYTGGKAAVLALCAKFEGDAPTKLRKAIEQQLWGPIWRDVAEHLSVVTGEHEMLEGDRPAEDEAAQTYDSELDDRIRKSLDGCVPDILTVSDAERLTVDTRADDPKEREKLAGELAQAIVRGPWDVKGAARAIGITDDEIAALGPSPVVPAAGAAEAAPDAGATVAPEQRIMVLTVLRDYLSKPDSDVMEAVEYLGDMGRPGDDVMGGSGASKLGFQYPAAALPVTRALALSDPDGWINALVTDAAKPVETAKPEKPPKRTKMDEKIAATEAAAPPKGKGAQVTPPAVLAYIEAMLQHTDMSEANLAAALGISRGTLNNVRKGKAHFDPNEQMRMSMQGLITARVSELEKVAADVRALS